MKGCLAGGASNLTLDLLNRLFLSPSNSVPGLRRQRLERAQLTLLCAAADPLGFPKFAVCLHREPGLDNKLQSTFCRWKCWQSTQLANRPSSMLAWQSRDEQVVRLAINGNIETAGPDQVTGCEGFPRPGRRIRQLMMQVLH